MQASGCRLHLRTAFIQQTRRSVIQELCPDARRAGMTEGLSWRGSRSRGGIKEFSSAPVAILKHTLVLLLVEILDQPLGILKSKKYGIRFCFFCFFSKKLMFFNIAVLSVQLFKHAK